MATTTTTKAPPNKPRKDRERDREKEKERKERAGQQQTERLKTVVRRLPANLPEEVFWQSVQNWVTDDTVSWKTFYPGKLRKKLNKENIPSRAYIAFKSDEQLALFSREYDGHLFRDKAGNESQAVVEFAPYQKVPAEKRKPDARNATIEKDDDYISFIESLKASANAEPLSLEALIASARPPSPPKTTPLLEALKAEKSAHKDKEAILRNHAHYKDQVSLLRNKEEPKKKGAATSANQKQAPGESGGKKGGRKGAAPPLASAPSQNQNQKAAQSTFGGGKNVAASGQTNIPTKPAKPSRQRQAQPPKVPMAHGAVPSAANPPTVIANPSPMVPAAASSDASSPAPRRARPVIGLASRQFEAALSGVGGASAGERKSRREREKERQDRQDKEKDGAGAAPSAGLSVAAANSEKTAVPPSSPKRDRGGRRGGGGGGPNPAAATSGEPQAVKVPGILQRIDGPPPAILQREASKPAEGPGAAQVPAVPPQGGIPGISRGGGRRGRGRGRGGLPGGAPRGG